MNTLLARVVVLFSICAALLLTQARAQLSYGGPDGGGYSFHKFSSPGTFQSIVGLGTLVFGGNSSSPFDDDETSAALGFSFPFYGSTYTTVHVSTNGLICLGNTGSTRFRNADLTTTKVETDPASGVDLPAIAPWWDDLIFAANQPGALYVQQRTVEGLKEFVVEWDRVAIVNVNGLVSFQAILREDGTITFHYPDADASNPGGNAAAATIGMRDVDGQNNGRRLQATYESGSAYLTSGDRIDIRKIPDTDENPLDFSGRATSPAIFTGTATSSVFDPQVDGFQPTASVWFKWVAPAPGRVTFSTAGSDFDTILAVVHSFTVVGTDDNGGGDGSSRVGPLVCNAGDVFEMMVAGKNNVGAQFGVAQVTATFSPAVPLRFTQTTQPAAEGEPAGIGIFSGDVVPAPLDVQVKITNVDDRTSTTQTVHFNAGQAVAALFFTPPEDSVFTLGRLYDFHIVDDPGGLYYGTGDLALEVHDNDPMLLPAVLKFDDVLVGNRAPDPRDHGLVTVTLSRTGVATGTLVLGPSTFKFKTQVDAAGKATVSLPRGSKPPLTLTLDFVTFQGFHTLRVTVFGAGADSASNGGYLPALSFSATNPVADFAVGSYTYTMTPLPGYDGYGYGAGTVAASGQVRFAGKLPDGLPFSFGTPLRPASNGEVFFYAYTKTHGGKGFFQQFAQTNGAVWLNDGIAYRPAGIVDKATSAFNAGYFSSIPGNSPVFTLSPLTPYGPPAPGAQPSPGFVNSAGKGELIIQTGFVPDAIVDFTLAPTGKATFATPGYTLSLNLKTGVYTGTRPNPAPGGKPLPFSGALLQTEDAGGGVLGFGRGPAHDATTAHSAFIKPKP